MINFIAGFIAGLIFMAFFYYRNGNKMKKLVEAANKERDEIIAKIKAKAKG
jgi:hypothetical protein